MSGPPRVLLIGRHFWPHGSIDSAAYLIQLATGLRRRGLHVEVLTPRYATSWAHEFTYRDMTIHRPTAAPRGDWSMGRYVRHLTTWLREHADKFDVLLADSGREEAVAAVDVARSMACRSIVRVSGWGGSCDSCWWKTSRSAKRCIGFAKNADRIVISNPIVHRDLIREGFDDARITRIDLGFSGGWNRNQSSRHLARRGLGEINADLGVPDEVAVVVCIGRMVRNDGTELLKESVRPLVEKFNDLQFWFIGDGPRRESIYEYLRSDGVRSSISMPGSFSDVEDVFAAADLYVQYDEQGLDFFLPAAISAELPIVMIDNDSTRQVISGPTLAGRLDVSTGARLDTDAESLGSLIHWVKEPDARSLRLAIDGAVSNWPESRRKAAELRRIMVRSRPLDQSIDRYARLIEETMIRDASRRDSTSIGAVS